MFGSLFRRHHDVPVLVANVESGSVAAAVILPSQKGPVRVVVAERADAALENRSPDQAKVATTGTLAEVAKKVVEKYTATDEARKHGPVQELHCIVGPSFSKARTVQKVKTFESEQQVNQQLIQSLATEALQAPSDLDASNILETKVTRVLINGYPTGEPVGKRAQTLTVVAFQTDINAGVRADIEHALGTYAPGRPVAIHSQTHAALNILHEQSPDLQRYLLIMMGSDATHCITVREDELTAHVSAPTGTSTVLATLAGQSGSLDETLSLVRMVNNDTCNDETCKKVEASLAQAETALVKAFGDVFAQLSVTLRVPNECILITRAEMAPWLENFFERLDFSQFSITSQPLNVLSLTSAHLAQFVAWGTGVKEDTGIGIAAAFVNINQSS